MPTAEEIINALNLQPLEGEGGHFRRTWFLPSAGSAPQASAIIYLVTPESYSALHRLDADEIFHFYLGDPCEQVVINANGQVSTETLGPDILGGQRIQTVVPKGTWQGTKLVPGGSWALLGTTMTPGFHLDGFELATRDDVQSMTEQAASVATSYLADRA